MSESVRRPLLPVALAAVLLLAAPAHAEPDAPAGAGRSGDTPAQSASLPAPDHAAAHEAVADAGRPADVPQGPPADAPQAPPARPAPDSASGVSGPAGTPSGDEQSEEETPGEVGGIGEDRRHGPASGNGGTGDVLPATGAPEHLLALGLLGATALLGGAWLALRRGAVGA